MIIMMIMRMMIIEKCTSGSQNFCYVWCSRHIQCLLYWAGTPDIFLGVPRYSQPHLPFSKGRLHGRESDIFLEFSLEFLGILSSL